MPTDSLDVLIVGAGPTGLTLACLLAREGVGVRLVEASPGPQIGSRGKGLQPRSLELFDDLGIVDRILANGRFDLKILHYGEALDAKAQDAREDAAPRPDRPFRKSLIIPQWRIEEALRLRLADFGIRPEFGIHLVAFTQDEGAVTAELRGPAGPSRVSARWLVACDGGKSDIRHLAGIDFLGETLETHRMLVADVHVDGLDRDHWHIWQNADGFLALCPLPSTEVFQFQASIAPGQNAETTLENCRALLERRSGRNDIDLSEPGWLSLWRANIRMVDRYRVGRILLAGDAAHVHSPAGGQGMNTGIQDAYNLAWKLAAVARGADTALLDSYEAERLPVAAGVLGLSTRLMNEATTNAMVVFGRRDETTQLGIGYRGSPLTRDSHPDGKGLRGGDRAPDATGLVGPGGPCRMFDLLRGPHVTLLGFGARWRPLIERCAAEFGDHVKGYVIAAAAGDAGAIHDAEGHARNAYGDDALFVVRPDNYVGLTTDTIDAAATIGYLREIGADAKPRARAGNP